MSEEKNETAPETADAPETGDVTVTPGPAELSAAQIHYNWVERQRSRGVSEVRDKQTAENLMEAYDSLSETAQANARKLHVQE